jgi:Fic family protein
MNSFENQFIEKQQITHNILQLLGEIREFKGKQDLFKNQSPQTLKNLIEIATIQSVESSNRIEGITAPHERIVELVQEKTSAKNRSEEEIMGYRSILDTIHQNHKHIPFTPNIIQQFHGEMYKFTSVRAGKWKTSDNTIEEVSKNGERIIRFQPVTAYLTPQAMDSLHQEFKQATERGTVDPLLLIATYIFDFLCIHPFIDGNGRISRLLTLYLLYDFGYEVGRYISLEKVIEENKESYYDSLQKSSKNWHGGKHSLQPWWEYFLGVLRHAYRLFEKRVGLIAETRGSKTALILDILSHFQGEFSIQELQELCPTVGIDLIRRILREEKNAGHLECLGRGPYAKWKRKKNF